MITLTKTHHDDERVEYEVYPWEDTEDIGIVEISLKDDSYAEVKKYMLADEEYRRPLYSNRARAEINAYKDEGRFPDSDGFAWM